MALVVTLLETDISASFMAMNDIVEGGNKYKAEKIAEAIKKYILAGVTNTNDTGVAPGGSYTGKSVGTMTIPESQLKDDLLSTFEAGYGDDDYAEHMATDIDNACSANNTVQATSTGTVTSTGSSFSGTAVGKFSGDKTIISTPLKTCFQSMIGMLAGGNDLYAKILSTAIDAYMKAGTIKVELKTPFISGSGSGKIT
jgi:hypothetical protein